MSTSSEESGFGPALQKAVRAELKRQMVEGTSASATERVIKRGKKRARTQAMEQVMGRVMKPGKKRAKKRAKKRVTELTEQVAELMEQVAELMEQVRVIKRKMKRKCKVVKVPQGARTSLDHQITRSEVREYQLLFGNKLHNIIYTKDKITDEDGGSVQIKLIDPITGGIIEKIGDFSLMEIEIVVLEGNFGFESHENWTKEEFNDKIVPQRGNHKPLVKGKQNITLREGVGSIDDLKFSVNSNWTNCKKFRLGARVLQSSSNMGQVRNREAITEALTVRDQRGKMNHLAKIKEGGKFHKALIDHRIFSGSGLKQMFKNDPAKLRTILKGCSKWEWEVIVHHGPRFLDDANSNPSRSREAEANNTATTGGPPFGHFQSIQQGSTGMQIDSNRASSSQYQAPNFQNSASQPADRSIPHSHDAQLIPSNDHGVPTGWYSSDDNHRTEYFQINNNEAEANNTAATGGPPFRRLQSIQQGSTGMQINSNCASSFQYPAENFQNSASQPPDMSIPQSHANAPLTLSDDSSGLFPSYQFGDFLLSSDDNQQ